MKRLILYTITFLLISCSTTELVDHWKNPDTDPYAPSKVLVVALTSNQEARQKFENQLKEALEIRGAEAHTSLAILEPEFMVEKMTEEEFVAIEYQLAKDGFDTVVFSKVIGVEDKIAYSKNFDVYDETFVPFREDFLRYQDIFYNPDYYDEYTVYHAETALYCICPTKERELLWKGYIDIVDPQSISGTVKDYVELVVAVLEEEEMINPILIKNLEE